MRRQMATLKDKAAQLKRLGETAAAKKPLDEAAAIQKKLNACVKAEDDASKPFPGQVSGVSGSMCGAVRPVPGVGGATPLSGP
ncbi:hypothetical protein ABZV75_14470 [Streptomyces flaveolus]|uniref:hypothetical protein n=1 Tax=Streptomyces flaveolus TaxID=67297 RepID=UPI0033AF03F0